MKKKYLAILLVLLLAFSCLFAGCGGGEAEDVSGGQEIEQMGNGGVGDGQSETNAEQEPNAENQAGAETGEEDPGHATNNGMELGDSVSDESGETGENQPDGVTGATSVANLNYSESQGMEINKETGMDQYMTSAVPEGMPVPVEPQHAVVTDKQLTCTLSISCTTILDNMDDLDPEKVELVPEDGIILAEKEVTFNEGENVFDVLKREARANKVHLEFVETPMYNSVYIEGIHNLYEFDCGELSGWMYSVNDWFPNYGCSRYQLQQGDKVEWVYTCDMGRDIEGRNAFYE